MRFDWNAYPETKEFVDGSGLTGVADTEEFRAMYNEACKIYREEGGQDELGKVNVKVYDFGDNLISRIVFKTCDLGRSKVHIAVIPHPSSYPTRSLGNPKRGPIALRVQPHSLDHLRLRNSEPFSPANKLTSNRSDVALPACRTNANASWDPWRKLVAPLKLWLRRKIITKIFGRLRTIITASCLASRSLRHRLPQLPSPLTSPTPQLLLPFHKSTRLNFLCPHIPCIVEQLVLWLRRCTIFNLKKRDNHNHTRLDNPPSQLLPSPMSRLKPKIHCCRLPRLLPKSLSRQRHLPNEKRRNLSNLISRPQSRPSLVPQIQIPPPPLTSQSNSPQAMTLGVARHLWKLPRSNPN